MSDPGDRLLALGGMIQALREVRSIADTGQGDAAVLNTALDSVFRIDAASPADVYGGEAAVRPGLLLLRGYLRNEGGDELLPRLSLAVMQLERRFSRHPMAAQVHDALLKLMPMQAELGSSHPQVLAALGGLYADTISHLRPRVLVKGNPHYLGQATVVAEIRAVLLAGVRSAVLWRQLGGNLWDFLLHRNEMLDATERWLA
jgi:high frequency lysogenization protein